jgi:cytochrome c oxidase cbb3-type subunit 3
VSADPDRDKPVVHEYDGIIELDNQLPLWWLYTLYGTVAFAIIYWFQYEILHASPTPEREYAAKVAETREAESARLAKLGTLDNKTLASLAKDPKTIAQGRAVFAANCAACHRADGAGLVGPNLTDNFWLHGGQPEQIWKTVRDGATREGAVMPPWKQLGDEKVLASVAYVLSLRNTNVPGGKAPQGEPLSE